jgi:two-component sensor histidine kinase
MPLDRAAPKVQPAPMQPEGMAGRGFWAGVVWSVRHPGPRPFPLRLAIGVLLYATAVLLRLGLDRIAPGHMPFVTFFPALALAGFVCGFWPSVLLLAAFAVTGAYWVQPASGDAWLFRFVAGLLFATAAAVMLAVMFFMRAVHHRLVRREAQIALVNRELKHRLRNLLALISSLCAQSIAATPPEQAAEAITGRLQAIAAALDLLDLPAAHGSDLAALVQAVSAPLAPDATRLVVHGPPVRIGVDQTTPFALILHELATNALKHGAWSVPGGVVTVQWSRSGAGRLSLEWQEQGAPPAAGAAAGTGFGSLLIARALADAEVEHRIGPGGAHCRVQLVI